MIELNLRDLKAVNEVFKELNNLRRWSSFFSDERYNELAKQALNSIVSYFVASYCEEAGQPIHRELFPKIAMYRAFQKCCIYEDRPELVIDELCKEEDNELDKQVFFEATEKKIYELTNQQFANFICEAIGTYEMQIYRVATKIATLVELTENRFRIREEEYEISEQYILQYLENFLDMPGVKELKDTRSIMFKLLRKISEFRNQIRWSKRSYIKVCPVLGHSFDTALFGYFSDLEIEQNEKLARVYFEGGLFHDIEEIWTGDFSSPIKKSIPGLKKALDQYGEKKLEQNFYACMPEFIANRIRKLLDSEKMPEFKKKFKGADYLSADSECERQYYAGTRDTYFFETAMKNFDKDLNEGIYILSPTCHQLHCHLYQYAQKCVKI